MNRSADCSGCSGCGGRVASVQPATKDDLAKMLTALQKVSLARGMTASQFASVITGSSLRTTMPHDMLGWLGEVTAFLSQNPTIQQLDVAPMPQFHPQAVSVFTFIAEKELQRQQQNRAGFV